MNELTIPGSGTSLGATLGAQPTMTSREIAELVDSRHDSVKRAIERLVEKGAIPTASSRSTS